MNLEDDLYGFTLSDGTQSYTLNSTVVDIMTTSTGKFVEAVEDALLGSKIKTSMDTDGNVFVKEMMVVRSFFSPLHHLRVNQGIGHHKVVKEMQFR